MRRVNSGKANRIKTEVMKMFHVKIGMRNIVIPGARKQTMVVIMLTAPRIVPRPETRSPTIHRSAPTPGELTAELRGV